MILMLVHKFYRRVTYIIIAVLISASTYLTFMIVNRKGINAFVFFDD